MSATTTVLHVDGMRCKKNCASKVSAALEGVEGVGEVVVDFPARTFHVAPGPAVHDRRAFRDELARAVRGAGSGNFVPSFPDAENEDERGDHEEEEEEKESGSKGQPPRAHEPAPAPAIELQQYPRQGGEDKVVVTLVVSGMSCASCSSGIERKLSAHPAVLSAAVSSVTGKAVVTTLPGHNENDGGDIGGGASLSAEGVAAIVRGLGYGASVASVVATPAAGGSAAAAAAGRVEDEVATLAFLVLGLTCAACQQGVENAVKRLKGVESVGVSVVTGRCTVKYRPVDCAPSAVFHAITELGYEVRREGGGAGGDDDLSVLAGGGDALPTDLELVQKLESDRLRRDLAWSLLFTVPVFFVAMVLTNIDAPKHVLMENKVLNIPLKDVLLLVLVTPVQFWVGRGFHSRAWKALRHGTSNMDVLVSLGTSAAYFYSVLLVGFMVATSGFERHTFFETSAMLITFILVGKFIETFAKRRTSQALTQLLRLQPPTANLVLLADNDPAHVLSEREVPVGDVLVGDVVSVRAGERVPSDGVVIHGSCHVDESMVTGESMPVFKRVGHQVVGGTVAQSGRVLARVERVGNDTALAQIVRLVEDAQTSKAPIQSLADSISAVFVPVVIFISVVTFVVWVSLGLSGYVPDSYYKRENADETLLAFVFAISVLVISCPCSLGLATPTAVVAGTGRGASLGILIKGADVLEKAGSVRAVVFDKTGTLTKGQPDVTGVLFPQAAGGGGEAKWRDERALFALVASAEGASSHPLATAMCRYAESVRGKDAPRTTPTDFETVEGMGVRCKVGATAVAVGNRDLLAAVGVRVPRDVEAVAVAKEEEGQTVVFVCVDGAFAAGISIADTIKEGAAEVVVKLRAMGIDTLMLTGDNVRTATAVARSLGIHQAMAQTKPQDKAAKVQQLQREFGQRGLVAMVGDGVNDSPALVAADLGIAIGSGTEVAVEAADIVLMKSSLWGVVEAIDLSRTIFRRIRINFVWAFLYNVLAIPLAAGVFYPFTHQLLQPHWAGAAMAASSICVVASSLLLSRYRPPSIDRVRVSRGPAAVRSSVAHMAMRGRDCKCGGTCRCADKSLLEMEQGECGPDRCVCGPVCSCGEVEL